MSIPAPKYFVLRGIATILPSITIQAGVDPKGISRDADEVQRYLDDPLVHDFATLATCES
jgi:acylglycerol lipase